MSAMQVGRTEYDPFIAVVNKRKFCCHKACIGKVAIALGALVFAVSLAIFVAIPITVRDTVRHDLKMTTPTSVLYSSFINASATQTVLQSYYFYNCTNADSLQNGTTPQLTQVGPYTYRVIEVRPESNISWHPNATIDFTSTTHYEFIPEQSSGSPSDVLMTVNLPFLALVKKIPMLPPAERGFAPYLADYLGQKLGVKLFEARNVSAMLNGFDDDLLKAIAEDFHEGSGQVPGLQADGNSNTMISSCYTGGDASKTQPAVPANSLRKMTRWQGRTTLGFWGTAPYFNDTYANMINGTDGSAFHPFIGQGENQYAFVDTLQRSTLLVQAKEMTSVFDIPLYRYELDPSNLQAGSENPANIPFGITYTGLQPYPAAQGVPLWASKPHFLDSVVPASAFTAQITPAIDAEASRAQLDTHIDVEPTTGQVLRAAKRLQFTTQIGEVTYVNPVTHNVSTFAWTKGVGTTLLPVFWADKTYTISESSAASLKRDLLLPLQASVIGGGVGMGVGLVLVAVGAVVLFLHHRQERMKERSLADRCRLATLTADGVPQ